MSEQDAYQLSKNVYISPTPAGAYFCVSANSNSPSRKLLQVLLTQKQTLLPDNYKLQSLTGLTDQNELYELLYRMQSLGWLDGVEQQQTAPEGVEDVLPDLLVTLSESGHALLADEQGFYLSAQGFPHETAEELSALSADIFSMYERHQALLRNNLGLETSAWALVDAAGNGQIAFWPLWVGKHRFVLVIKGVPLLNNPALMKLIWALSIRYGE
ncbi:MAG: hypothetical protein Q9N32_02575 [Gammaproteobacteria bacterium]|nr:hypothetical protein [Gammaproteobacteria bacterium]